MRRAVTLLFVVLTLGLAGCAGTLGPAARATPAAPSTPVALVVPDVLGDNADVALDTLHKVGFTNIDLGTVDGRRFVILPQNWTVKAQSAKPGTRLAPNAKIVLGCARIGGFRLL